MNKAQGKLAPGFAPPYPERTVHAGMIWPSCFHRVPRRLQGAHTAMQLSQQVLLARALRRAERLRAKDPVAVGRHFATSGLRHRPRLGPIYTKSGP